MTSNPMYCPISFAKLAPYITRCDGVRENMPNYVECTPDCAWAINNGELYACAIVVEATNYGYKANSRPLKDDGTK